MSIYVFQFKKVSRPCFLVHIWPDIQVVPLPLPAHANYVDIFTFKEIPVPVVLVSER